MDTLHDHIQDSRVAVLGLSVQDFERFALEVGIVTKAELDGDPSRLSRLMSEDNTWNWYEEYSEERYQNMLEDQRLKHGGSL